MNYFVQLFLPNSMLLIFQCHSALVSPESEPLLTPGRSVLFQRSISEIATSSPPTNFSPANTPVANETNVENKISVRRRNKSGDVSGMHG